MAALLLDVCRESRNVRALAGDHQSYSWRQIDVHQSGKLGFDIFSWDISFVKITLRTCKCFQTALEYFLPLREAWNTPQLLSMSPVDRFCPLITSKAARYFFLVRSVPFGNLTAHSLSQPNVKQRVSYYLRSCRNPENVLRIPTTALRGRDMSTQRMCASYGALQY